MPSNSRNDTPERGQTDESLRLERDRTDQALAERQQAVAEDAEHVLHRARETADAVLAAARGRADEQLESGAPDLASSVLAEERGREDAALREERAIADENLERERDEAARALALLLPLERVKTDRFLLTERRRSDDALANRDDFMGIVSHDLRNLLGGIVMTAAILGKGAAPDTAGQETIARVERIQRYAARMNRLIGDLVDVASIDAGKLALAPADGDAAALVDEAVEMFYTAAAEKGITLTAQIGAGPVTAFFDHDRMLQVLVNVITNAIKFTDVGTIAVRTEPVEGGGARIAVHDTGTGVPAEMLEAIFERFWQAGKNDRRGSGLGLYISKCIVDAHGGRIWAESRPGEGTVVSFTIPGVKSPA
jgi:signal transduction histidine kinase